MESCLVIPREKPPTLSELKRALLTYEHVYLTSPDDRELIPPSHFVAASSVGIMMPISMDVGPVRPLGKVAGYDTYFQYLIDECKAAVKQGSLVVLDTPALPQQGVFSIGALPECPGWPDPVMVYRVFREMAATLDFVQVISRGMDDLGIESIDDLEILAPRGADDRRMIIQINDGNPMSLPPSIAYQGLVRSDDEIDVYTRICLARLGSLVKSFLRCRDKNLVPFSGDSGVASAMQMISKNCAEALMSVSIGEVDNEKYIRRLKMFDRLVVSEFIPRKAIEEISVDRLLRLRSKAWGAEKIARKSLSEKLKEMSQDSTNDAAFERSCRSAIHEYKKAQENLESELSQYRIQLLCNFGVGVCGVPAGIELAQRNFMLSDLGSILVAGGVLFKFLKEHAPDVQRLIDESRSVKGLSGYALFRTYQPFAR
jgi:hypothetical protein